MQTETTQSLFQVAVDLTRKFSHVPPQLFAAAGDQNTKFLHYRIPVTQNVYPEIYLIGAALLAVDKTANITVSTDETCLQIQMAPHHKDKIPVRQMRYELEHLEKDLKECLVQENGQYRIKPLDPERRMSKSFEYVPLDELLKNMTNESSAVRYYYRIPTKRQFVAEDGKTLLGGVVSEREFEYCAEANQARDGTTWDKSECFAHAAMADTIIPFVAGQLGITPGTRAGSQWINASGGRTWIN